MKNILSYRGAPIDDHDCVLVIMVPIVIPTRILVIYAIVLNYSFQDRILLYSRDEETTKLDFVRAQCERAQ